MTVAWAAQGFLRSFVGAWLMFQIGFTLGSGVSRWVLGTLSLCRRALQKDQSCKFKAKVQIPAFFLPSHPQQYLGTYPDKHYTEGTPEEGQPGQISRAA